MANWRNSSCRMENNETHKSCESILEISFQNCCRNLWTENKKQSLHPAYGIYVSIRLISMSPAALPGSITMPVSRSCCSRLTVVPWLWPTDIQYNIWYDLQFHIYDLIYMTNDMIYNMIWYMIIPKYNIKYVMIYYVI